VENIGCAPEYTSELLDSTDNAGTTYDVDFEGTWLVLDVFETVG
jgi:hypothetical protein